MITIHEVHSWLVRDLRAGKRPIEVIRDYGPMIDREIQFGILPGPVGFWGEVFDGLAIGVVLFVWAHLIRRKIRHEAGHPVDDPDLGDGPPRG